MKRLQLNNINTDKYWNSIYKDGDNETSYDNDKFEVLSNFVQSGWTIADFGCGTGNFLRHVLKKRKDITAVGFDISKEAIRKIPCQGFICDLQNISMQDNYFDFISCFEVLEHMDKPQKVVDEIYRLLKNGGLCVITMPFTNHFPSKEHVWEFNLDDINFMLLKFSQSWVFPFASGRSVINDDGTKVYPKGNLDNIYAIAIK